MDNSYLSNKTFTAKNRHAFTNKSQFAMI